jgi:hypothetical protein
MGDQRIAWIIGVAMLLAGFQGTAAPDLAQAQSRCTNTGRTCTEAKAQGLAWCRTSPNARSGCAASVEMSYVGCLQSGRWKTSFCDRRGLAKR